MVHHVILFWRHLIQMCSTWWTAEPYKVRPASPPNACWERLQLAINLISIMSTETGWMHRETFSMSLFCLSSYYCTHTMDVMQSGDHLWAHYYMSCINNEQVSIHHIRKEIILGRGAGGEDDYMLFDFNLVVALAWSLRSTSRAGHQELSQDSGGPFGTCL